MEFENRTYIVDPNGWVNPSEHPELTQVECGHPVIENAIEQKLLDRDDIPSILESITYYGSDIDTYREIMHTLNGTEFVSSFPDVIDSGVVTSSRTIYLTEIANLIVITAEYYQAALEAGIIPVYAYEGSNELEANELEGAYDAGSFVTEVPYMIELLLKRTIRSMLNPDYDLEQYRDVDAEEAWFSDAEREEFRLKRRMKKDLLLITKLAKTITEVEKEVNE